MRWSQLSGHGPIRLNRSYRVLFHLAGAPTMRYRSSAGQFSILSIIWRKIPNGYSDRMDMWH